MKGLKQKYKQSLVISERDLNNYKKTIELFNNWFGFDIVREVAEVGEFLQANWHLNVKYFDTKCKRVSNYAFSLKSFVLLNCCADEPGISPTNKFLRFLKDAELKLRWVLEFAPPARKQELEAILRNRRFQFAAIWKRKSNLECDLDIDHIYNALLIKWIGFSTAYVYKTVRVVASEELKN